jgi:hypothetical protein
MKSFQTAFAVEDWIAEEWRPVQGFPGYEVSNMGKARSFRVRGKLAMIAKKSHAVVLHQDKKWGYWHFGPRREDGKRVNLLIHIVVAAMFIGPCPDGLEVNHKDGNKANNCHANLEYSTSSENQKHAFRLGLQRPKRGSDSGHSKLTERQVRHIRRARARGVLLTVLAEKYEIGFQTISAIARRKSWTHVR